jgi:chorismate lyase/3-hydroxybenzoate synthase
MFQMGIQIQYLNHNQLVTSLARISQENHTPLFLLDHSAQPVNLSSKGFSVHTAQSGLAGISDNRYELWSAPGSWDHAFSQWDAARLVYSFNDNYLVGSLSIPLESQTALQQTTQHYYERILTFIKQREKPNLIRMWNYFPNINQLDEQLERYQAFCIGRHTAFTSLSATEMEYPAASAVGSGAQLMNVVFITASRPARFLENPAQVSAYHYPKQYSPKSPSFARASLFLNKDLAQLYVSGTASIVGHESRHHGDIIKQTTQTLTNLKHLINFTNAGKYTSKAFNFHENSATKVYLRYPDTLSTVSPLIDEFTAGSENICYLQADICRSELDIEIEILLSVDL